MSTRADNWIRELAKTPAAQAAGAGLLDVCSQSDPAVEEVAATLTALGKIVEIAGGRLCVRVPGAALDNLTVYREPAPELPEIDPAKVTVRDLAEILARAGLVRLK